MEIHPSPLHHGSCIGKSNDGTVILKWCVYKLIFAMKVLFLLPLVLLSAFVHAQPNDLVNEKNPYPNAFKLSFGPASLASSPGIAVQSEYALSLGRFFEFVAGLGLTHAYDGLKNETRYYEALQSGSGYVSSKHYSLVHLGPSICLTPVKNYNHRLLLGAGLQLCHLVRSSSVMNGLTSIPSFGQSNDTSTGAGFNVIAGYEFIPRERFLFGIRGSGLFFKENAISVMASVGYRFD